MRLSALILFVTLLAELFIHGNCVPSRCPVVRLQNGKVRPRARGKVLRYICYDGFTLVGNKYSTCEGGQWDTPAPVCVNAECLLPPAPQNGFIAPKYGGAVLIFFCTPGYLLVGPSEIYCNGKQWNSTIPYCRDTTAAAPTSCDFEKTDLCWWEQDPQHDFDWKRHNFETPSYHVGTGPTHDHTLGPGNDGYYLYIEASGRLVNDTARIFSPLYNASLTDSGCFSFWYHMFGEGVGDLNIYFKTEKENTTQLMFTKHGNQGNQWLHGLFDLPKTDHPFQIIIEGVRGISYVSDIAVDDVALLRGDKCSGNKSETVAVTQTDDDQVERVNAMQSCRGRCTNSSTLNGSTVSPSEICYCTIECMEHSVCCPDFAAYCLLGATEDSVSGELTEPTTISQAKVESNITDIATLKPNYYGGVTINSKDDIDPVTIKQTTVKQATTKVTTVKQATIKPTTLKPSTIGSVTQRVTVTATRSPATTTREQPTTKLKRRPSTKSSSAETLFAMVTTPTKLGPKIEDDQSRMVQDPEKLHRNNSRFGLRGIIWLVIGVLTGLTITTTVAIFILRRRKTYKRGCNGSALSEDSDVRFLTSDEVLDFNLARPTDNDEA